jgi:hypothetical protein
MSGLLAHRPTQPPSAVRSCAPKEYSPALSAHISGLPACFHSKNYLCAAQGIAQAKAAHKRRNAVPATTKQAKDQRPTGRGGFGVGRGREAQGEQNACRAWACCWCCSCLGN